MFNDWALNKALALGAKGISGCLIVTLPNGETVRVSNGKSGRISEIQIHDLGVFRKLYSEGWVGFSEAYLEGKWETPDLQGFMDHMHEIEDSFYNELEGGWFSKLSNSVLFWLQRNHREQARKNISYHYDLGNDFYSLWLDDTMTYSSALFETGQESLEKAQIAKYASMVDQMGAKPGDHILEIGCGWGGFAEYAAKERGLRVTGLTISKEQLKYAQERIEKAGL